MSIEALKVTKARTSHDAIIAVNAVGVEAITVNC